MIGSKDRAPYFGEGRRRCREFALQEKFEFSGTAIAIGIALGVAIGLVINSIIAGIGIGIAMVLAMSLSKGRARQDDKERPPPD